MVTEEVPPGRSGRGESEAWQKITKNGKHVKIRLDSVSEEADTAPVRNRAMV